MTDIIDQQDIERLVNKAKKTVTSKKKKGVPLSQGLSWANVGRLMAVFGVAVSVFQTNVEEEGQTNVEERVLVVGGLFENEIQKDPIGFIKKHLDEKYDLEIKTKSASSYNKAHEGNYKVLGRTYNAQPSYTNENIHQVKEQFFVGKASYYGDGEGFVGKKTSNQENYTADEMTLAHPSLPMNTIVEITNPANETSVFARVNDRGPFMGGRIADMSKAVAQKLDLYGKAPQQVILRVDPVKTKKAFEFASQLNKIIAPQEVVYEAQWNLENLPVNTVFAIEGLAKNKEELAWAKKNKAKRMAVASAAP